MAPLSGCNLICKNPSLLAEYNQSEQSRVSEKCQLGSAPPPRRCSACSYLVRYFQAQSVNNGVEQTTITELKNAPPLPTSKRRNKKSDEVKQCKKKELRAGEKTRINIRESFQRSILQTAVLMVQKINKSF